LFNALADLPDLFVTAVLWVKVIVIGSLLLAVLWFNQVDHDETWQGGDILIATVVVGMELMIGALVVGNVVTVLIS
jgi:hypothetical protein